MLEETKQVKFINRRNPKSRFDLLKIESLYERRDLDHSIEKLHKVDFFVILFFESGEGHHTIDFVNYSCSKGTLLTIRKDQIHKFVKSENIKGKMLLFTEDFLASYLDEIERHKAILLFNEFLGDPKFSLPAKYYNTIVEIIQRIENEYFDIHDSYSLSIIRSELQILLTKLFRLKTTRSKELFGKKYLKDFLEFQVLVESKVKTTTKVKDYASILGRSTKTLNTITQSIVHKSAKEFIDELCTTQIKRLLINTELSVKEIAFQMGFQETSNFYKYFKRQTKITPEQFRASYA